MSVYMPHVFRDLLRPKEDIGSLELELQVFVPGVGAGIEPASFAGTASVFTIGFSLYLLTLLCFEAEASICSLD